MPLNKELYSARNGSNQWVGSVGSDVTDIATRAIYVGTGGNLEVDLLDGATVKFSNVPDGTLLPIQCTRVDAGNSTAYDLVLLT